MKPSEWARWRYKNGVGRWHAIADGREDAEPVRELVAVGVTRNRHPDSMEAQS